MLLRERKNQRKKVEIGIHDVIDPETIDIVKVYGYPVPMELLDSRNPQKFEEIARNVGKKLKSLGGRKGHAKGDERKRLEEASDALREYKKLIEGYPKNIKPPKHGRGIFYYNNPRDLFD